MPRARSIARTARKSSPLSPCSVSGRRRGCPALPRTGGRLSTTGSATLTSLTVAAVSVCVSGMPFRSVTRCRLLPGFPRSVGCFPVLAPRFSRGSVRRRSPHGSSRGLRPPAVRRAPPPRGHPRRRPLASRAADASRLCQRRSPSPAAGPPTGYRSSGRRECLSGTPGPGRAGAPRSASAALGAGAARSGARNRQIRAEQPYR